MQGNNTQAKGTFPSEKDTDLLSQKPWATPAAAAEQQVNISMLGNQFPTVSLDRFQVL